MRRVLLLVLVTIIGLASVFPTLAAPPDKDDVKLKVFVHYPRPGKPQPKPGTCDPTELTSNNYGLAGWRLPGPTQYRVNYNTIPGTVANAQTAIARSFAVWQQVSGVTLSEGDPTTVRKYARDGQNVVVWGNVPGGAIAVTYIWYNSTTGYAVEVDTVMGRSLPWSYTPADNPDQVCGDLYSYDVQNILTHEVGHWMGLDDLYEYPDHDLTMYGYGDKGELKKDTLMTGDSAGIARLY